MVTEGGDEVFGFPCDFPLKIMGLAGDDLPSVIGDIVQRHAPDFDAATITVRSSAKGKYMSLTCKITATSRQQLDALYRELSRHPRVKFLL